MKKHRSRKRQVKIANRFRRILQVKLGKQTINPKDPLEDGVFGPTHVKEGMFNRVPGDWYIAMGSRIAFHAYAGGWFVDVDFWEKRGFVFVSVRDDTQEIEIGG